MSEKLKTAIRVALAGAALSIISTGAHAAGAVGTPLSNWLGTDNIVGANETITTKSLSGGMSPSNGYTDNIALHNSAWGHAVQWLNFQVTAANQVVTITDAVLTGTNQRAFTVWASNGAFNGGTTNYDEIGASGSNTPHTFNAVGQLGSAGTVWATDPSVSANGGGNLLKTLAYVNAGNAHTDSAQNDWGEVINAGVNQLDNSGTYFNNLTGSYSNSVAQLVFTNLAAGWYTVATGGANSSLYSADATHQLTVTTSAVPLPGAVYLFGTAVAGLAASARRKQVLA